MRLLSVPRAQTGSIPSIAAPSDARRNYESSQLNGERMCTAGNVPLPPEPGVELTHRVPAKGPLPSGGRGLSPQQYTAPQP